MSTCTEITSLAELLQAIESLEINEKYNTKLLDSEKNESYLKTFRRRVGALYKCAMKIKFTGKAAQVLDKHREKMPTKMIYINGTVGNDFVVVKTRGAWRVGKMYLEEWNVSDSSFFPSKIDEFEYDDIKGHQVPNWEESLEITKKELDLIKQTVEEMIHLQDNPEEVNVDEYIYST